MKKHKPNTALLISGGGSTAEAIIKASQSGQLDIQPVVVIASLSQAGGLEKAQRLGVPTCVVVIPTPSRVILAPAGIQGVDSPRLGGGNDNMQVILATGASQSRGSSGFSSLRRGMTKGEGNDNKSVFGFKLLEVLHSYQVELVSQNGWMPLTPSAVIDEYQGRIINQHPGPLDPGRPDFGGKGMYGSRVTCARLAYLSLLNQTQTLKPDEFWTEATIHYITEKYDQGQVLDTYRLNLGDVFPLSELSGLINNQALLKKMTQRAQAVLILLEHKLVIRTLQAFSRGKKTHHQPLKPLVPQKNISILQQAKETAIKLFPKG
ncbi:MAG: formyltransferase family protein [Patescibacteria group bacterium]|nr:hypothetical protein [Patescibacteria group bacterium]